ncbi:hypothetical protein NMY22_g15069 [Coprinellus aureogranulatus]|nr:hypothetical protein NMY22_g15069 [Coprinellus aureogranulatus]
MASPVIPASPGPRNILRAALAYPKGPQQVARARSRDPVASSSRASAPRSRSNPRPTVSRSRYPPGPSSRLVASSPATDYGIPQGDVSPLRGRPQANWNSPPPSTAVVSPTAGEEADETAAEPLWKQVVATLTVNVSKALSATVGEGDGESTPVGAESRLTKAMKAYYLSKARSQADLPDWLFSEKERRVTSRVQRSLALPEDVEESPPKHPVLCRSPTSQ